MAKLRFEPSVRGGPDVSPPYYTPLTTAKCNEPEEFANKCSIAVTQDNRNFEGAIGQPAPALDSGRCKVLCICSVLPLATFSQRTGMKGKWTVCRYPQSAGSDLLPY